MGNRRSLASTSERTPRGSFAALATQTREVSPARPTPHARAYAVPAVEPGRKWFWPGVGGLTAAVAVFLLARLTAWPPHEDETLALFVGRNSLGGLFHTVQTERGGAPLHFLCAWLVVHLGGGLVGLRLFSALFAVASVPVVALLARRIAGAVPALVATALVSASWMLLFHGIYGRMYSLFLLTSAVSYLACLDAVARGGGRRWALWALAVLLTVATHPYGALVLASQVVYVLTRARTRAAFVAIGSVALLGTPFWYSDLVLAGRFDVGVGSGGKKLDGPWAVLDYLFRVAGDFTAGYTLAIVAVLVVAAVGARVLWLSESERGLADRRRDRRSDGGVPARPVRRVDLARVAASDLRAPVLRGARRARPDPADAAEGVRSWSPPSSSSSAPRSPGAGTRRLRCTRASRRAASRRARRRPSGLPRGRERTTSSSATSRSISAAGSATASASHAQSSRARTRSSRSTRCGRRSRSATASGSSTPRIPTTSRSR